RPAAARLEEDVVGLHVPVHHALAVGISEGPGDGAQQPGSFLYWCNRYSPSGAYRRNSGLVIFNIFALIDKITVSCAL
ncbi:MAG TPA: hypothetical protein PK272_01010, partial [Methanoregulaceae archaeon]|nr:hypothetical protein [Methanoregulaceae archaeon]